MRITFLCGSLEPGRDGVGDYTRLLAEECVRQGHECLLVALFDRHLESVATAIAPSGSGKVSSVRLPASLPWAERNERALNQLGSFNPDWISVQFVCYGFHPKGLVHGLGFKLQPLIAGRKVQIMFHELWIGEARSAPLKHRLIGALQRRSILQMARALKPKVVHTSTPIYVALLGQYGIAASPLTLFGNIPVSVQEGPSGFPPEFVAGGIGGDRSHWWIAVLFGTLHPEWTPEPLFALLQRTGWQVDRHVGVVSVGRLGSAGELLWEKLRREHGGDMAFVRMGEQPANSVSHLLRMADFGIATSPLQLIGKSGSAAAMLEHGLPVIANRDDWHPRRPAAEKPISDSLVHPLDAQLEAKLLQGLEKRQPAARLALIAAQFFEDLRQAKH